MDQKPPQKPQPLYYPHIRRTPSGIYVIIASMVIGLITTILLSIGIYGYMSTRSDVKISAPISDTYYTVNSKERKVEYNITATYTVDGKEYDYHMTVPEDQPRKKGELVTLYYNPENPSNASPRSFDTLSIILFILSPMILLIGLLIYIKSYRSAVNAAKLPANTPTAMPTSAMGGPSDNQLPPPPPPAF